MKRAVLTLLLLITFPLMASHIVGGEFELVHISGNTYQLNLIIYFDQINGAPGAKDPNVTAHIYRKRDRQFMTSVLLPRVDERNVPYTQPECSNGEIITSKLTYTTTIVLSPDIFNDPAGYYVVWERCCRNYTITNIYSQVPQGSNIAAGQTFYLEFPPVVKNGQAFINSSPRLFPPLNDFACPNRNYYVDFAGVDDDGDSLVYSLVTPLNTTASVALPAPNAGPYPNIVWRPGYGLSNIINGSPDLRISKDGLLTATPTKQGLFVFAVKIEEFRDKEKIGESRRDFQMLVVDACPQADPPQITGKKLPDTDFNADEVMNVSFSNTTTAENRCINVRVSDPDASKIEDKFTEKISIKAVPLNFKKNISEILPAITTATLTNGSTKDFTICFPQCPYLDGPFQIGIIAYDDACSLPLSDTLKINVNLEPPANTPPYFVKPVEPITNVTLTEGDFYESTFEIRDDDGNNLIPFVTTNGFQLKDAGITVTFNESGVNGLITGKIRWEAFCNIFDFTQRNSFEVTIAANDSDICDDKKLVSRIYKFNVILPGNADPAIDTDLTPEISERTINLERRINESLNFTVTGKDLTDNDFLVLDLNNRDALKNMSFTFPKVSGSGSINSTFNWNIRCTDVDLKKKDEFLFQFIVVDNSNKCRFYKADTVDVNVKILPPLNTQPELSIYNGAAEINDKSVPITLGEPIRFDIIGTDIDVAPQDLIKLSLIEATGSVQPVGYLFTPKEGNGKVQSSLIWSPDCSVFQNGIYENDYTFKFRLADDRCFAEKADTVTVKINLKDVSNGDREFLLPNVFTPNNDGCNDYFALEGLDACSFNPDPDNNTDDYVALPPDNCIRKFEFIRIYNRWGNEVFKSTDRKFRWYAADITPGVYFYVVKYTDREYKSSLSVRF